VFDGAQSSQATPRTRPWFHGFIPSEDKDQEDYFHEYKYKDD
jgi:hypothetical protein